MISTISNSPNFTGIVPVRVFVDGHETLDEKVIKSATRQLTSALTKPKDNPALAEYFSKFDPQYAQINSNIQTKPSDFFRLIIDKYRGPFLVTGKQTRYLNELGRSIGIERRACLERGGKDSLDLLVAKRNYGDAIASMLSSANLRLYKVTDQLHPLTLYINVNSKKLLNVFFNP